MRETVPHVDLFVVGVAATAAYEMLLESFPFNMFGTVFMLTAGFGETDDGAKMEADLRLKFKELQAKCTLPNDQQT